MPTMQLQDYVARLQALAAELDEVRASGEDAAQTVELDQSRVGRLSRMDALQAQAMSQETRRRRALQRQRVSAALQRIDADEFGWCLRCGEAVGEQRLQYDPSVTLCIDCAHAADAG